MPFQTFAEYVAAREGLIWPSRAPAKGLPRINATLTTNAHRRRIRAKAAPAPDYFRPTIRAVVPPHLIPRIG